MDLGILIDGSGSIEFYGTGNFRRCLNFIKKLFSLFTISPEETRVGVMLYSTTPQLIFNFKQYSDLSSVDAAIDGVEYPNGKTNTGQGLTAVKEQLFGTSSRPEVPHILLVMTDGISEDDISAPSEALRKAGVTIISLGIGHNFNKAQLTEMASESKDEHVFTVDFQRLDKMAKTIKDMACRGKI